MRIRQGLLKKTWRFLHEQGFINSGVLQNDPMQGNRWGGQGLLSALLAAQYIADWLSA